MLRRYFNSYINERKNIANEAIASGVGQISKNTRHKRTKMINTHSGVTMKYPLEVWYNFLSVVSCTRVS